MLHLLLSVSLDPAEQSLQLVVLLLVKDGLLFLEFDFELVLHVIDFSLLEVCAYYLHFLSVQVVFD